MDKNSRMSCESFVSRKTEGSAAPIVIDVRASDERAAMFLPGTLHIPLDELPARVAQLPRDRPIVVLCHSGVRSELACETLRSHGWTDVKSVAGGLRALRAQGAPVVVVSRALPIMRQVQIVAGVWVILGVLLSQWVAAPWIWLSGLAGVGLVFAGVSGFCGMAVLLSKMPWNRHDAYDGVSCES